jgi:hypothetical protein
MPQPRSTFLLRWINDSGQFLKIRFMVWHMLNKSFGLIVVTLAAMLANIFFMPQVYAACIGGVPVWGTGDTRGSCADKQRLKKEKRVLENEEEEREIEERRQRLNEPPAERSGLVDEIRAAIEGEPSEQVAALDIPWSVHQFRVEFLPYAALGAHPFDEPGMPEQIYPPGGGGFAWEYFVNKNLGFGFLWQELRKEGGRDFDPVMAQQRDGSGDTAVFFPGAVDEMKYSSYMLYASLNLEIAPQWIGVTRFGIGKTIVKVDYSDIDQNQYPFARQTEDVEIDSLSIMGGLGAEYMAQTGTRIGGELRYMSSRNDSSDYTEYFNTGGLQVVLYIQFMIQPLGLL